MNKRLQDYQNRQQSPAPKKKPPENQLPPPKKKPPRNPLPPKPKANGGGSGRTEYTPPRTDARWREQRRRREQRRQEQTTPQVTREVGEWPKKLQERVSTVQKLMGIFGLGGDD